MVSRRNLPITGKLRIIRGAVYRKFHRATNCSLMTEQSVGAVGRSPFILSSPTVTA